MAAVPVSVCTTTKNSAPDVYRLLESVEPIADEIVVLDTDSTDGTREICDHFGATVYQHEFRGFADLKRTAMERASNDWVFVIDADEKVPPELREEIQSNLGREDVDAFYLTKTNYMFGEETNIDHPKRPYLANREAIEYKNDYMNETLSVKEEYHDRTADLDTPIMHFAYEDFEEYLVKWNQYSSLDALQAIESGARDSFWSYLLQGIAHWGYYMVKERAFLNGRSAILFAFMSFQYKLVVWWKLKQLSDLQAEDPESWKETWIQERCQR